jgi:Domain of unknown function (DUF5664)
MSEIFGTDYKSRKNMPVFDGVLMYFPDAIAAVAAVSMAGNAQHNPGEKLHWAREKSTDQFNTATRHMMDHGTGARYDTDHTRHLAKAAWRILAALQLDIEAERETKEKAGLECWAVDVFEKRRAGGLVYCLKPGCYGHMYGTGTCSRV